MADRGPVRTRNSPKMWWFIPAAALVATAAVLSWASSCDARPVMKWTDTAVVESIARETIVKPPSDLQFAASNHQRSSHQRGGASGGAGKKGKGYLRKASSKGNDGYSSYDAFHTKSGDKYGYEKHSSFGKKKASKKDDHIDDGHGSASHRDVEVIPGSAAKSAKSPRYQSLKDVSGDAFTLDGAKYRRGLHDEEGDLFFVFTGDYTGGIDGGQEGEAAQQQEGEDDHADHSDDGEAQEQQAAEDDDGGDDESAQQKQKENEDDYDY